MPEVQCQQGIEYEGENDGAKESGGVIREKRETEDKEKETSSSIMASPLAGK